MTICEPCVTISLYAITKHIDTLITLITFYEFNAYQM